jgi:predicted enzyme related to lactoylglutathione lyase
MNLRVVLLFVVLANFSLVGCEKWVNNQERIVMQNQVNYFEIPVDDLDRAIRFYQTVFGYVFQKTIIDGNQMALFPSNDQKGINGALAQGDSYKPSKHGVRIYFNVKSIDQTLEKVMALGGRVLYPKTAIGDLGFVAEIEDSEGNCIALHSH